MLSDSGEHFRTYFLTIVKRPDKIWQGTGGVSKFYV